MATTILNKTVKHPEPTIESVIVAGMTPDADLQQILKDLHKTRDQLAAQNWQIFFAQQKLNQAGRAVTNPTTASAEALEYFSMCKEKVQEEQKKFEELDLKKQELQRAYDQHPVNVKQREMNEGRKPTKIW